MLRITCPNCGILADETELHCDGQAHIIRHSANSTDAEFETYLFARANPLGVHFERWRHVFGCGKWFHTARCTQLCKSLAVIRRKPTPRLAPLSPR